jgi:Ca2+-binding RTX toxin-like protein
MDGVEDAVLTKFDDTATGDDQNNTFYGGDGNDTLSGGIGDDTLVGGNGADTLKGGAGADVLDGGGGGALFDTGNTASYDDSSKGVTVDLATGTGKGGDAESDTLINIQDVIGSDEADVLNGDDNANELHGGKDNDVLQGRGGADVLDGQGGNDTASYADSGKAVTVNLATGEASGGDAEGDTLTSIENLTGSGRGDHLTGDGQDNIIDGGKGADTITGGRGADTLIGGGGNDTFVFTNMSDSPNDTTTTGQPKWDKITDFVSGVDKIDLSQIDADNNAANGDTAFTKVGSFDGASAEVKWSYDSASNTTTMDAFDGTNHFELEITGVVNKSDVIF